MCPLFCFCIAPPPQSPGRRGNRPRPASFAETPAGDHTRLSPEVFQFFFHARERKKGCLNMSAQLPKFFQVGDCQPSKRSLQSPLFRDILMGLKSVAVSTGFFDVRSTLGCH